MSRTILMTDDDRELCDLVSELLRGSLRIDIRARGWRRPAHRAAGSRAARWTRAYQRRTSCPGEQRTIGHEPRADDWRWRRLAVWRGLAVGPNITSMTFFGGQDTDLTRIGAKMTYRF